PYNAQAIRVVVCHEKRQSGTAQRLQASQLSLFPPFAVWTQPRTATELLDDHRALEPPDPIPNSEVKRCIADGSVGLPHVRVGHRQASNRNPRSGNRSGFVLGGAPARRSGVPSGGGLTLALGLAAGRLL